MIKIKIWKITNPHATCTQIWLDNKQKQNLRRIKSRNTDNCSITSNEVFAAVIELWLTISTLIALIYKRKQPGTERDLYDVLFLHMGDIAFLDITIGCIVCVSANPP